MDINERKLQVTFGIIGIILGYQASRIKDLDRSLALLSYNMNHMMDIGIQREFNKRFANITNNIERL